ncbi:hypothetical protein J1N35_038505 [Gossypium stocksii]|uniref:CCHC-type domain-containing protein n=1 Tax=Gossypium stocksii TaxID=47602 RepID=A0A9D3UM18_9ROSI|nr:hypothetical protein J1N35_038505 [Gossypium stocksii]
MEESGGDDREGRDEISLLAEELIQLSVKGSMVVPSPKPTLICTVWTKKLYNPESFRAQMKSIWKTWKKFEIQKLGQNLFLIVFELEEDLKTIIEGRPWLFRKKFDKKDLLHAIDVTFGGVIKSEINGDSWRLRINLDVQEPLRQGIFVSIDNANKSWVPFKYENLPMFCFGCRRMGHGFKDCLQITPARKRKISDDPPYTLALKVESKLMGKEILSEAMTENSEQLDALKLLRSVAANRQADRMQ